MSDAFDQKLRADDYCNGSITIGFSLAQWSSLPKVAGVTLSYEGQYPLEFRSDVEWPTAGNFEADVRAGMLDVLLNEGVPVIGGIFRLIEVSVHPVEARPIAFRIAAREATFSLLRLLNRNQPANQTP
jgi:hypothetical protein